MAAATITYQPTYIAKVTIKQTGQVFYAAPSCANDGTCYRVQIHPHHHTCTCPDFTYRRRDCKHIEAVLHHLEAVASEAQRRRQAEEERWERYQLARMGGWYQGNGKRNVPADTRGASTLARPQPAVRRGRPPFDQSAGF